VYGIACLVRGRSLSKITEVCEPIIEGEMEDIGGFDLGYIRDDKAKVVGRATCV